MAIITSDKLIEELRAHAILTSAQIAEVERMPERPADSRDLLKELVGRQWLTRYQAAMAAQGRSKELVLGTYILLDRLGEGGMGEVFRARHVRLERIVALKIIRCDKLKVRDAVSRFEREARAAAQLHHPNIVTLFEEGREGDILYLAMEFIKGVDLARWVKQKGPMPIAAACTFVRQAALGLQHAHERGLVHRDIKPSNLMLVAGANMIKVLDMGLARFDADGDDTENGNPITVEGTVMGTPDFLAPEQAKNAHSVDIRADIYGLGCSLYFLVTGSAPFSGGSLLEKLLKHQSESPRPLAELRPDAPPQLQEVIDVMMAKKPDDRFQTPAQLASALAPFCKPGAAATYVPLRLQLNAGKTGSDAAPITLISADADVDVELVSTSARSRARATALMQRPAARPFTRVWMAQWGWLFGVAGGLGAIATAVLLGFLFLNMLGGHGTDPTEDKPAPAVKMIPTIDDLAAENLPYDEAFPWQPKELVAVIGTHKWRHWASIKSIAFNPAAPTGHEIASFGDDDTIRLCNASTGRERWAVPTPGARPGFNSGTLVFSQNGRYLAALNDGKAIVYETTTGREEPVVLNGAALAFLPGGNLAVGFGDRIDIRALPDWKSAKQIVLPGNGSIVALAVADKVNLLAALTSPRGKAQAEIHLIQLGTWLPKGTISLGNHQTRTLQFARDGTTLITAAAAPVPGNSWPVIVWDAEKKKEKGRAEGNQAVVVTTALSRDGQTLVTGATDGTTRVFSLREMREKSSYSDHDGDVFTVALSPDDAIMASAGKDASIRFYDLARGKELDASRKAHESWAKTLLVNQKRTVLAVATIDHSIHLVQAGTLTEQKKLTGHRKAVVALALSTDNRILASGSLDKTVNLWDMDSETELAPPILGFSGAVQAVAFGPEGRILATGTATHSVKVLDAGSRKELGNFSGHSRPITAVDFFRDGKKLISASEDGSLRIWDLVKGKEAMALPAQGSAAAVAVSPRGRFFASASSDGTIRLWDSSLDRGFWAHRQQVSAGLLLLSRRSPFALTPALYLSPLQPPLINSWRNALGANQAAAACKALAYSPDSKLVAVGCANGMALYELPSGRLSQQWELKGAVNHVLFDSAGKHLLTVNSNGTAYILRLSNR